MLTTLPGASADGKPSTQSDGIPFERRIRTPASSLQLEDPDVEEDIVYRVTQEDGVTDQQLRTCADQFSSCYGVWSDTAWRHMGFRARPGSRVCRTPLKVKDQCLPKNAKNYLTTAVARGERQVGYCFVSQWCNGDDWIWWITQLLVLPTYRKQRRATRMLQAFAEYSGLGKVSDRRDFVGIISANPYVICTVLWVFACGTENLPSKLESNRAGTVQPLLPQTESSKIIQDAPLESLRSGQPCTGSMTIDTGFYLDHHEAENALERIVFGINKQIQEPWLWPFGDLPEAHEYLCVLEYRHDPECDGRPQFCAKKPECPTEETKQRRRPQRYARSTEASRRRSKALPLSDDSLRFAEVNAFLKEFPKQLSGGSILQYRTRMTFSQRATQKRIVEARGLIDTYGKSLAMSMDAKPCPKCLQDAYMTGPAYAVDHQASWKEVKTQAFSAAAEDEHVELRLLLLQAVHFKELLDDYAKLHGGTVRPWGYVGPSEASKTTSYLFNLGRDNPDSLLPRLARALSPATAWSRLSWTTRETPSARRTPNNRRKEAPQPRQSTVNLPSAVNDRSEHTTTPFRQSSKAFPKLEPTSPSPTPHLSDSTLIPSRDHSPHLFSSDTTSRSTSDSPNIFCPGASSSALRRGL